MKNRTLHFALLLTFLVSSAFTPKQDAIQAGNKQPNFRELETSRPVAEIKFVEMHFRKPPLVELIFDVVLRNDRAQPRWFVLPSNLYPGQPGIPIKGGVDTLEVLAPHGEGRVIVGHLLGTGGFQALLLPAHAEIHLRALPISYWGDVPDRLQLEVIVAKRLMIADKSARTWFQVNPMCSTKADISETISGHSAMPHSRHTPDNKEVNTHIDEDLRLELPVSLTKAASTSDSLDASGTNASLRGNFRCATLVSHRGNSNFYLGR